MRQIKLSTLSSRGIVTIGNWSQRDAKLSDDLGETLSSIFPERKSYWEKHKWKSLNISFRPVVPFGPDPEILSSYLFENLEDDLQLLINKFSLREIIVSGLPSLPEKGNESRKQLHLTALELKKLIEVCRSEKLSDFQILSVFVDPENIFTFAVSSPLDFSFLFSTAPELKNVQIEDFIDTINGVSLNGEDLIGETPVRYISQRNWRFESNSNILFNYPEFNRKIRMTESSGLAEEPCINCLTCAAVCPAGIYPATIYHHLKEENLTEAIAMGLNYCMFCRRCSVVCPSRIPLSAEIIKTVRINRGDSV
jgi:ferredoxin